MCRAVYLELLAVVVFIDASCTPKPTASKKTTPQPACIGGPLVRDHVFRSEAMATARAYTTHQWTATERNRIHGYDPNGIRVDTPDVYHRGSDKSRPGWWRENRVNHGMPYKWGGFDTPDSFDAGLRAGKYAGDVYSEQKRARLDDAVSAYCVGIDCSGLVSRCWKLPRSYSTRELPGISTRLASFDELKPGDILNTHNRHVLLFEEFADTEKANLIAYEAGSPPTWKVLRTKVPTHYLKGLGYIPFRYKGMRD